MPPEPTQPFNFMGLPKEIRDTVYGFYVDGDEFLAVNLNRTGSAWLLLRSRHRSEVAVEDPVISTASPTLDFT
jgi:hypothetical protein